MLEKEVINKFNKCQKATFNLISSDARFIYELLVVNSNNPRLDGNYVSMMFRSWVFIL